MSRSETNVSMRSAGERRAEHEEQHERRSERGDNDRSGCERREDGEPEKDDERRDRR